MPPDDRNHSRTFTRRTLLAAVPGAMLMAAGVSCGSDDDVDEPEVTRDSSASSTTVAVASPASTSDGEWTFTDDLGTTITLPKRPERIVAYVASAASLWDFGVRPVGVYGTTLRSDGTREITTGSLDLEAVESLGEVYGELDIERLVALKPDLIIGDLWTETLEGIGWGLDEGATAQVEAVAPIVVINYINRSVSELIESIGELAGAVGADLDAPDVVEAREGFEQASADVEAAIAEKSGLTAMFIAGWQDALYVANPEAWADLIYFQELGLDIVMPDALDKGYPIWQTLSWEQANKYPADLVLQDARAGAPTIEELSEIATWAAHPAAQADQVFGWRTEFVSSYQGFTVVLEDLKTSISESRGDVV